MSKKIMISKDEFLDYETVRRSGFYNMLDAQARELSGLSAEKYATIMEHYRKLKTIYMED